MQHAVGELSGVIVIILGALWASVRRGAAVRWTALVDAFHFSAPRLARHDARILPSHMFYTCLQSVTVFPINAH